VRHHLPTTARAGVQGAVSLPESLQRLLTIGTKQLALPGAELEPQRPPTPATVQIVGIAEAEAVAAAQGRERRGAMPARALAFARKGSANGALVDARLGHPDETTLSLAGPASGLTPKDMNPRLSGRFGVAPLLLCALLSACSRSTTEGSGPAPAAPSATAAAAGPLAEGAAAPDVTFPVHSAEPMRLSSLRGKPVVVYFYPKDDTPGCTVEANEIRELYSDLQQTGAVVIGVSTDDAASHRAFAEKHSLPFYLASDESGELAKAFGVPLNGGRASRMSFVIGPDGRIKRAFPKVTPQGHAAQLLEAIRS
jgi:peroxiredoxin Q/BCP